MKRATNRIQNHKNTRKSKSVMKCLKIAQKTLINQAESYIKHKRTIKESFIVKDEYRYLIDADTHVPDTNKIMPVSDVQTVASSLPTKIARVKRSMSKKSAVDNGLEAKGNDCVLNESASVQIISNSPYFTSAAFFGSRPYFKRVPISKYKFDIEKKTRNVKACTKRFYFN